MKKKSFIVFLLCLNFPLFAQKESSVQLKPYGFVCNYMCYDTRESVNIIDEMFHIMPKDVLLNEDGTEDLNDVDKFTYVSIVSRLGLNLSGVQLGKAQLSAKMEADFCGSGTMNTLLRIRQAYVAFDWEHIRLLCGQSWHPMVDQMMPTVVGVATGSPFAPFNCSPQVRMVASLGKGWSATVAALYQASNASIGPDGASSIYAKWSRIPECYVSLKYAGEHLTIGAGLDILGVMPRSISTVTRSIEQSDGTLLSQSVRVRVNDRVWGFTPEIFASYKKDKFNIMGKVMYAQNTAHLTMVSGFGATSFDAETGSYDYAPLNSAVSWINATYGERWKAGLMLGYIQNLGSFKEFISLDDFWVRGAKNTNYLYRISPSVTYTINRFQLALEVDYTVVGYGDLALNGCSEALRRVDGLRGCFMVKYSF